MVPNSLATYTRHPRAATRSVLFSSLLVGALLCTMAGPLAAQRGGMTRPVNLGEMVETAGVIIRGHVLSIHAEKHPELTALNTLLITVRVSEALKGQTGDTYTFRQYVWDVRDVYDSAGYKGGQEVLLILSRPSQYGLSSPVGLQQGRFLITRDRQGNKTATNGILNYGLFNNLPERMTEKGVELTPPYKTMIARPAGRSLGADELTELIRQMVRAGS